MLPVELETCLNATSLAREQGPSTLRISDIASNTEAGQCRILYTPRLENLLQQGRTQSLGARGGRVAVDKKEEIVLELAQM